MESLTGRLLISTGGLYDPNFRHTVVLIGHHDQSGAVGITLNRAMDATVADVVPALAGLTGQKEPLFAGGPVEPRQAVILAEVADPGLLDVPVVEGVGFLTGEVPGHFEAQVRRARVYLGHAGWGPKQLEAELSSESWVVEPATADDIFTRDPDGLWRRVLKRKGPPYSDMARIPFDPTMN